MDSKQLAATFRALDERQRTDAREKIVTLARDLSTREPEDLSAVEANQIDAILAAAGLKRGDLSAMLATLSQAAILRQQIDADNAQDPTARRGAAERQRDALGEQLRNTPAGPALAAIKDRYREVSDSIPGLRDVEMAIQGRSLALDQLRRKNPELLSA